MRGKWEQVFWAISNEKTCLSTLATRLTQDYGLAPMKNIWVNESVVIFLYMIGHETTDRNVEERFQHSSEIIR